MKNNTTITEHGIYENGDNQQTELPAILIKDVNQHVKQKICKFM